MARRKPKPQRFRIDLDQWGSSVTVLCGTTIAEAEKLYCKRYAEVSFKTSVAGAHGYTLCSGESKGVVLWFALAQPGGGVVCHEAIHAAWHILDFSGVSVTADNHEALAYLTDFIVRQIGKRIW